MGLRSEGNDGAENADDERRGGSQLELTGAAGRVGRDDTGRGWRVAKRSSVGGGSGGGSRRDSNRRRHGRVGCDLELAIGSLRDGSRTRGRDLVAGGGAALDLTWETSW